MPSISPSNYKHNITNDSVGGNPFATQAMIALHQIQSSHSQSRAYPEKMQQQRQHSAEEYDANYVPWTGRNHYQEDSGMVEHHQNNEKVVYYKGQ